MKKHITLFLALFMLVSVFFTMPVEAAQLDQIQTEQSHDSICKDFVCGQISAPRVTDMDVPSSRTVLAAKTGNETTAVCSHTFKPLQHNSSLHKKVCTKCDYTTYAYHTFKYTSTSATKHKMVCTVCGYSTVVSHSFKYQNCGNTHQKYCSLCGYSTGEAHSYNGYTGYTDTYHKRTCTRCGAVQSAKHSFSYTDRGSTHKKYCGCGFSVNESHINGDIKGKNASSHAYICTKCNHITQESHIWGYSSIDDLYHSKHCTKCYYGAGSETHDYYEWAKGGFDSNGIPFRAIWKCRNCGKMIFGPMPDPGVH